MEFIKDSKVDVRRISPKEGHYFFGYYDLKAYSKDGKHHLCNKVDFIDRMPTEDDVLKLGVIDLETNEFSQFAETTAWNFQQGTLLQWHGKKENTVFYNIRRDNEYYTVEHNLTSGEKSYFPAVACLSQDGSKGLKINFNRIYDFRPGYGYAGLKDKFYDVNTPEDDGVFLVDTKTGEEKQIIDYERLKKLFPIEGMENAKFVINHITFNPSGTRFLILLRNFPLEGSGYKSTSLITSDLEGNVCLLIKDQYISHYYWKNDTQILAHCRPDKEAGLFLIDDITGDYVQYEGKYLDGGDNDIHCIYSPDRRYIIGDGYPDADQCRNLYIYDTVTGKEARIFRVYSMAVDIVDMRCDLHARFNEDGTKVSFDSTHEGKRCVYEFDFEPEKFFR